MATLLAIKSSIFGDNGNSSLLVNDLISVWQEKNADGKVVVHDFAQNPLPHLDAERVTAIFTDAAERTPAQQALVNFSDQLIRELKEADAIVMGVPMYNFGVPSNLKAWIDHVARAGETFKYTEQGPVGLVNNKPVFVVAARGGQYQGTDLDAQTTFLKTFLGFIGLTNITFIYAEGLNMGAKDDAFAAAKSKITDLLA